MAKVVGGHVGGAPGEVVGPSGGSPLDLTSPLPEPSKPRKAVLKAVALAGES